MSNLESPPLGAPSDTQSPPTLPEATQPTPADDAEALEERFATRVAIVMGVVLLLDVLLVSGLSPIALVAMPAEIAVASAWLVVGRGFWLVRGGALAIAVGHWAILGEKMGLVGYREGLLVICVYALLIAAPLAAARLLDMPVRPALPGEHSRGGKFRFSIGRLLWLTAGVAAIAAVFRSVDRSYGVYRFELVLLPPLVASAVVSLAALWAFFSEDSVGVRLVCVLGLAFASGCVAMLFSPWAVGLVFLLNLQVLGIFFLIAPFRDFGYRLRSAPSENGLNRQFERGT